MHVPTFLHVALRIALASVTPVIASAQHFPSTAPPSSADTITRKPFDIPAQPLDQALVVFRQTSLLAIDADAVVFAGIRSHPVAGVYTSAEALRVLLAGTGLTPDFLDDRTVVLRAATSQTLPSVQVRAGRTRGYSAPYTTTATRTSTLLRDVPQSISIVTQDLMKDLSMQNMTDVVRFVPGVTMGQGEGNRDQPTIRGNNTTADFFVDGVRDDVQYFRDLYNAERIEALRGSNAMIFGRGGGGGVINRVTKEADWSSQREVTLQGGSFDNKRASVDVSEGLSRSVAARLNGMVERSGLYRDGVTLERYGINPTITIAPRQRRTRATFGYEFFADQRTADRGIPSFEGRPIETDISTFFGDPAESWADVRAHLAMLTVTHAANAWLNVRNRTQLGSYHKFYQNVFPGAVNAAGDQVTISAYNNDTQRHSVFNQTDVLLDARTGPVGHTLLLGAEIGRQGTGNLRNTGYFNNATTSVTTPVADPTVSLPLTFRPSATDADNRVTNTVGSIYVQDQIAISDHWQVIAGIRYERFNLRFLNNRTDSALRRTDDMISPRAGLLFKPLRTLSFYGSHSVSYLPSAGDQFSSLTEVTKGLEPERFTNYETGAKWDVADRLALSGAVYRLDRLNTRAPDPADPTKTVQTGSQRSSGIELSISGSISPAWEIAGAYANQTARISSTTAAAPRGAQVPLVPRTTLSLWNRYQLERRVGVGVAVIHRTNMYAALDNAVTLPGFTEVDAALYLALTRDIQLQANVENVLDIEYYPTAHSNNNITPGSRRAVRVALTTRF